jgi:sulfite exporter TauE/SafE
MGGWLGYIASAAFAAGLLGGVHCAAMCGPIVAACSNAASASRRARWPLALAYNGGRIISYATAGAIAGFSGQTGLALRGGTLTLEAMSIIAGAALIVMALCVAGVPRVKRVLEAAGGLIWRQVQPYSRRFLPANTVPRAFGLGTIWGWLPCGMVYAVLVTAVAAAGPAEGALVMLAFGLGTLPNVLALGVIASRLKALRLKSVRIGAAAAIAGLAIVGPFAVHHVHGTTADALYCRPPALAGAIR